MSLLAPLSLALLIAGQLPPSTPGQLPGARQVELSADRLLYEPSRLLTICRGHAVLRSGEMVLRADELTYDDAAQRATARGGVMFFRGTLVAVAGELDLDLGSQEATARDGLFMQKANVSPEALLAAKDRAQLEALGKTTLALHGTRLRRLGPDQFEVDGLSFTPCDCDAARPSWHIEAARADIKAGERAALSWPRVYVNPLPFPVFALPWIELPMSDRRTGLLVPRPSGSALNGFSLEQPVFVTLGPSYDLTLTPGYYFGARESEMNDANGQPILDPRTGAPRLFAPPYGVQGPRLLTELNYAPDISTRGWARLDLLYDLRPMRDPADPDPLKMDLQRIRGLRGEITLHHTQDLGSGFHDRADVALASDGYYPKDLITDVLQRENQYLRSTAALYHRDGDSYAGLELGVRQDLRWGYSLFDNDRSPTGEPLHGPNTLQRLPALRYALPERPLIGPVFGSATVEYTRLAPLVGRTGDEGTNGVFDPLNPDPDGSQGDRRYEPGEREARDRLDLRPRVSAELAAGRFARFTPYLAWRQDLYMGEVTGRTDQRGYPLAGVVVDTELSRTFGPGDNLRHAIDPSVELRYVPAVFGAAPPIAYDEVDAAVPGDGLLQAVVQVNQRLQLREGSIARELLRLDVGQGFDLKHGLPGDTFGRLAMSVGWLSLDAVARYNLAQAKLTVLSGTLGLDDGRGDQAYARYDRLLTGGSDQSRRGLDELIGPLPADPGQPAELLVAGARTSFKFGLGGFYEALVQPQQPRDKLLAQQRLGLSYSPSCNCWRIELSATFHPGHPFPDLGGSLTLERFGSFGAGG